MKFNGNITLNTLGQSEIQNLVVERLNALPAHQVAEAGRLVFNTGDNLFYMNTGVTWVALATGGDAASLQTEVDNLETSLGSAITSTGAFNAGAITVVAASSITDAINKLGASVEGKDSLSKLLDVALSSAANGQFLKFDGSKWVNHTMVLANVSDVTASATEVNHLVGVTSGVQGQLNALDGAADAIAEDLAEEVIRAKAAEKAVADGLAQELLDRAAAVNAVAEDLAQELLDRAAAVLAEENRAKGIEAGLRTDVDAKVAKAGDSMTGNLAMGGNKVIGIALPTSGEDAANKNYVDSLLAGLAWEKPVDMIVADAAAVDLSGKADGFRIVDTTANKIFTVAAGALDAGKALEDGDAFFHKADETGYVFSGTSVTQFTGGGQITAGIGLAKNGNQLDVNLGAGIAQLPSDEVGVDVMGSGGLFLTVDGTTASTDTGAQLAVKLDGTSIVRSADGIKVDGALTTAISDNTTAIATEKSRAEAAELALTNSVAAEKSRAEAAELVLTNAIADEAERADLEEKRIVGLVEDEAERADLAEKAIVAKIAKGYHLYDGAELTSHTVTHNIGSRYCNVTVIDSASNEQIIPQAVIFDTNNQLTVTFNVALACKVVVMGLGV
jgi:hypothetical protein